jgi:DNA-binding MarR family transcriptional regulator
LVFISNSIVGMEALRKTNHEPQPDETWAGMLLALARCGRLAQRALAAQLDDRFSPSQAAMLWACRELAVAEPSQLELAKHLGLSPAQVSAQVETLRSAGLIVSERSPHDRRRQTWQLTAAGEQATRQLDEQLAQWSTACSEKIGDEALEAMSQGIHAVQQLLDHPPNSHAPTLATETTRRGAAA